MDECGVLFCFSCTQDLEHTLWKIFVDKLQDICNKQKS